MSAEHRPFSERTYYVPFGRYQPGGDLEPPDQEVLVGRKGQRDYFLDLLFRMGGRGAFLVTGQRGIGKTTFVRHCLSVHEQAAGERFLNNNVGRATFWDRLGVLIIGIVLLLVLEMTSQLVHLLALHVRYSDSDQPLAWILLVILVVICLYPVLFAREVLQPTSDDQTTGVPTPLRLKAWLCVFVALLLVSPIAMAFFEQEKVLVYYLIAKSSLLGLSFVALVALFHNEYTSIISPILQKRPGEISQPDYNLARLTLPWILFKTWLPVLTVPVNLGFEKLDHKRVIHAMLAGLREQYKQAFLSWSSGFANLVRLLGAFSLVVLASLIGAAWFEPTEHVQAENTVEEKAPLSSGASVEAPKELYSDICRPFREEQIGRSAPNLICKIPGGDALLKILYYNLLYNELPDSIDHRLFWALPYRTEPWPLKASPPFLRRGVHFEIYYLVLLGLLYLAGNWLLRRTRLLPYGETLRRIDEVLDFLSARTSVTSRTNRLEPFQAFQGFFVDERTRQTDQDPADPRTVEFLFLQILNDIQSSSVRLGGRRNQIISLPSPEVTFFFDELDKLGTRIDPTDKEADGSTQQAEILHAERRRSIELHRLLADMKNLLSSAPARFIFVGGRNLHDEWLADQSARQPLLTNIFNAEIYLPSLLTDMGRRDKADRFLDLNIAFYLQKQHSRAQTIFTEAKESKTLSLLSLRIQKKRTEGFYTCEDSIAEMEDKLPTIEAVGKPEPADLISFKRDLRQFLTYRSMGHPKRLKELLGGFVRPTVNVAKGKELSYEHVLAFGDTERFRVQLVARIYRHLTQSFERRIVNRDDKLAVSLFYLSDFLFKFHRRAFSWGNLERVDELVHIHRAPDLREILEALVGQWTERFLHPIRNGMYDFRFRSDLSREVEYISRQSAEEMAAFNFTLDESQALKSAYRTNIAHLKEKTGTEPVDMVAGLGELHEFDQEYEDARVYYWRAIMLLDARITEIAGPLEFADGKGPDDSADSSVVFASFVASARGRRLTRHFLTWGISRLRLMLQIGMTFELTRNLERAGIEYRNANTLAAALRAAMLDNPVAIRQLPTSRQDRSMHPLKHLNILFQPVFAEAWIAEKLPGAIDTGISLIEKELWTLRSQLPFVKDLQARPAQSPIDVEGSNFSLIMAEMHNKAGDLYFFKGRQRVTMDSINRMKDARQRKTMPEGLDGYLLRAHYHYAVALQEMRRVIAYRREGAPLQLGILFDNGKTTGKSIDTENWPDFIYRSAGGALNDLAEATLGRVSLYGFFCDLPSDDFNAIDLELVRRSRSTLLRTFVKWMESVSDRDSNEFRFKLPSISNSYDLRSWLGHWTTWVHAQPQSPYFPLVNFTQGDHQNNEFTRLLVALQLKMVGTKLLEKGGYIEGAAHELLGVCEVITHYLWWRLMLAKIHEWAKGPMENKFFEKKRNRPGSALPLLEDIDWKKKSFHLVSIALYCLNKASLLFRLGRKAEGEDTAGKYLVGNQIPVAQFLLTCSLGLAISRWPGYEQELPEPIPTLLNDWNVPKDENAKVDKQLIRSLLKDALVRHSYPMVNRLHGLKVLIDDSLLESSSDPLPKDWISELIRLTGELDAPMHFTPLHSGVTYALAYCKWRSLSGEQEETKEIKEIRGAAQRDLRTSEEMFTLRRAYYENISDLTYLYDDFNDRQLHLSHGIQMAGAEINALFYYMVTPEPDAS